ncbi:MAG: ribonuclease P protein component [Candidatus Korobacteraceae bacterium]
MSDIPRGSFPKTAHLLKHSDFQRVYQQGRRYFSGNMTVFYLRTVNEVAPGVNGVWTAESVRAHKKDGVRVGFTVSRALGGSVERNRMRRRTREAVRRHLQMLQETSFAVDVVINPKKSLLAAEFRLISQEIERAFRVIRKDCEVAEEKSGKQEARHG